MGPLKGNRLILRKESEPKPGRLAGEIGREKQSSGVQNESVLGIPVKETKRDGL